ncbi:MAG: hypothetical protein R2850_08040, partial [Bacteroidia bacterium]
VQHESFFIVHSRPGSVFIEWLPWIAIQAGWPMEWIIRSLSLGEYIWFLSCFSLFAFVLKSRNHAISLVLVYIFGLRWNYFNPVSELLLAFPLFILLHYVWQTFSNRNLLSNLIISWVLGVFLFFCHPLYILALPVMLAWFWLESSNRKALLITGIGLAAGIALRYFFLDSYEKDPLSTMNVGLTPAAAVKRFISIKAFIELGKCYAGSVFLLLAASIMLFRKQQKLKALLVPAFALAFFGLVAIKFGGLYPETFEPFERYLFILPLLIVVVYQSEWATWTGWKQTLLIVFVAWHVFYIHRYSKIVTNRYEVFDNALFNAGQYAEQIVPVRKENYHPEFESNRIQGHDWIMSSESMLLSSIGSPEKARQVYIKEIMPDDFYEVNRTGEYMYYTFGWLAPVAEINRKYINLGEARWRIANTDSVQEYTNESIEQIKFEIVEMPAMKAHEKNILQITLKTTASNPLFSGMKKKRVGIGYLLEHNGNSETGKFLTPLMFDLVSEVRQRMVVVGPDQPGSYTIIPGWQVAAGDDERFYPFGEKVSVEFE